MRNTDDHMAKALGITDVSYTPAERAAIYDSMVTVMAEIHKVDYIAVGLGPKDGQKGFGRPGGSWGGKVQGQG